uniref:Protein MAK10 homolog n=2 Tax=Caenorhabditis japonica TaxID=281687 RepID=A0A8R1E3H1_CAEJA
MPAVNETPAESEDISAVFFELCDKLEIGELVTSSNFRLSEVMSAIELAEPKMDVGVGSDKILSLESARENGTFAEDYPLHLAVIDATLSMLVAWLEGSSLASTIWTNILLLECSNVNHKTYTPLVNGINLLVRNIHALVSSVGNLEELPEDFNPQEIFQNTQFPSRDDVVGALRKRSAELTEEGKKLKVKTKRAEEVEIRLAIATRLELVAGFLEILGWLVPPDIEDPNYHQNYSLYTTPKSSLKKDHVNVNENENDNENENENTKSADPTPDCDDVDEICDEEDDLYDDDVEIRFFPNFTSAAVAAERLAKSAQAIHETVKFGRHSPDGVDGDYTWLPCFDQKACIHFIPACFPRSVTIPSRKNAACWLVHCARRIHDLSITTPSSTRDLNHLFYYARTFTLTGCVLTRSLLQICMFPADNHLCGDPHRTLAAPIELSLKQQYEPQIQDKESPVYKDDEAQQLYLRFINYMVKASISVYTSLGCNLSRQRDRLEIAIEELGAMQCHAMKVEERIDEVLVAEGIVEKKEDNISYNSISTFVFHNMVAVIHHYYEIGFRMDLYVPYEFTYIFWFLSEVEAKWMLTTMERSHEIQIKTWKASELVKFLCILMRK